MAKLVKHCVGDLLDREELSSVAWIAKPQKDFLASVYIQSYDFSESVGGREQVWRYSIPTEQIVLIRIEFTKLRHLPASGPHDGLHQRGDPLQHLKGVILPWEVFQVCVRQHQGVKLRVLNHGDFRVTAIVVRVAIRVA